MFKISYKILTLSAAMLLSIVASADGHIWHVKSFQHGHTVNIKAIDADGNHHNVKAMSEGDGGQVLSVKAMVNGSVLPIKLIDQGNEHLSVKAIHMDGTLLDIKAVDDLHGPPLLNIKGVAQDGVLVHIKAVAADGTQYGVKAISPDGRVYDIKGLRFSDGVESTINGVEFHGHIKAIPPGA